MLKYFMIILLTIIIDQYFKEKILKCDKIRNGEDISLFKDKLIITLVKNYGAALNFLSNKRKLLITLNTICLIGVSIFLLLTLNETEMEGFRIGTAFMLGGGLGNFIDRIKRGYVIDFIYFNIRKMPVFNLADFFIIGGAVTACINII